MIERPRKYFHVEELARLEAAYELNCWSPMSKRIVEPELLRPYAAWGLTLGPDPSQRLPAILLYLVNHGGRLPDLG